MKRKKISKADLLQRLIDSCQTDSDSEALKNHNPMELDKILDALTASFHEYENDMLSVSTVKSTTEHALVAISPRKKILSIDNSGTTKIENEKTAFCFIL